MAGKNKAGVYVRFYELIDSETNRVIKFETRAAVLWRPGDPEPKGNWVWYSPRENSRFQELLRGNPTDSRGVLKKAGDLYHQALAESKAVEQPPSESGEEPVFIITDQMRREASMLPPLPPGCGPGADEDD